MRAPQSLCVALDGSDRDWLIATATALVEYVGWFKVGLEAFTAHGPALVEEVAALGPRVFLDLKLYDIPATVRNAAANCASCRASMFTVHAAGGREMLEAALDGAVDGSAGDPPMVVAVTVLTSLDGSSFEELEISRQPADLVTAWSRLARECGLHGVVASAHEAAAIRRDCGDSFLIVTPGIRPSSSTSNDQRRVATPGDAIRAGADILVIGRPITGADDPVEAAKNIADEMESAI